MRILLDEQLPRQLAACIEGHDARTTQQQGWAGLTNGELLQRASEAGFDVFLTADQNLEFQQNLQNSRLFTVVLIAPSNRLEDLVSLIPAVLAALELCEPGRLIRIPS